jgi:hypothetical protein
LQKQIKNLIMKHFETIEQLHQEWRINGACTEGVDFNKSCKTLEEVFETCPLEFRLWRLRKGYLQFAEHCVWTKLDGDDWSLLLYYKPQFAENCNWTKLDGRDWAYLLFKQLQFAEHCDWSKLKGCDWSYLLSKQPQFAVNRK